MAKDARKVEEESTMRRSLVLGLQYTDTSLVAPQQKVLYKDLLNIDELKNLKIIPLQASKNRIDFGITNTTSQRTMRNLKQRFADAQVYFSMISDAGYREYMKLYDPPKTIEYADIQINANQSKGIDILTSVSKTLQEVKADDMLAYLVQQSFSLQASDIHLESKLSGARIRLRVHGVLHTVAELDDGKYRQLIGALASAADLSTSSEDDQTGHINKDYTLATGEQVTVNLRVETVPAVNGVDAVLRMFNFNRDMMSLEKLGLDKNQDKIIRDIIAHPTGLALIVGPTGSGKTTTLYSILNELNTDERKIITLEDPVEYQIEGITQIPVSSRKGQSFADKFKAVLRLDPDVIMVGEIRDLDTAKTALQAALTGHLVLSTYHASSAAAALTRLLDAIGENPLYASAIRLIQAQRLVRQLDDTSKQAIHPDENTLKFINGILAGIHAPVEHDFVNDSQIYGAVSNASSPFGYDGQLAIREMLTMTPAMKQLLGRPAREITTELIEQTAVQNGMLTLQQDGVVKVLQGKTTLDEITRVVG